MTKFSDKIRISDPENPDHQIYTALVQSIVDLCDKAVVQLKCIEPGEAAGAIISAYIMVAAKFGPMANDVIDSAIEGLQDPRVKKVAIPMYQKHAVDPQKGH